MDTMDHDTTSTDEVIAYLSLLQESVADALRARKALLSDLLIARREPENAVARAGRASRRCVRAFDYALSRISRRRAPPLAGDCVRQLQGWLEAHVEACDLLNRAAAANDRADYERALHRITDGALHALGYNEARSRLARVLAAA